MQSITPFLWFNDQAEEAASFYVSVFRNSKAGEKSYYNEDIAEVAGRPAGSVMAVDFQLEGQDFIALNGNDDHPFTPAISFFVACETPEEIDRLWQKLSQGGVTLMELGKYPFSEKYGWVQDKFGVSWQLILRERAQKIAPCLLFVGKQAGKAEEAMNLYTSVFPNSRIVSLARYTPEEGPDAGRVKHAIFSLDGQDFSAMTVSQSFQTSTYLTSSLVQLYVNGTLKTQNTNANSASLQSDYFLLGCGRQNTTITDYLTGTISEFIGYNRALTSTERQTLESSQKSYFSTP